MILYQSVLPELLGIGLGRPDESAVRDIQLAHRYRQRSEIHISVGDCGDMTRHHENPSAFFFVLRCGTPSGR